MKKLLAMFLSLLLALCPFAVCAEPAADAPLLDGSTLVTFGDSLTALSTWPRSVAAEVNVHLVNSGIGGNTTAHGLARFERDVLAHSPDFVIMCFGSNDFYLEDGTNPRVSVTDYKANLQYFIDEIEAIGGVPILMTPPFISDNSQGGSDLYPEGSVNAALDKYVAAMREVASANGTHLIDIHAVCDSGNYSISTFLISDGVHLSDVGNQVYTETIVSYLQDNFNQDPTAPRVETLNPPALVPGAWTRSLISFELDDWLNIYPDTLYGIEEEDGAISFANTTGLWPEIHYSPEVTDTFYAPVEGSCLTIDLELDAATSILLFFNGPNPTLVYENTYVALSTPLAAAYPSIQISGNDILGQQDIRCTLALEDVVPAEYIADDGTILFSGVKVFAVGEAHKKVTINELSVTTTDGAVTPEEPTYQDADDLLPDDISAISQNQGKVDYVLNGDGSLLLSRSAESDIAWPSIKVTCGQSIDLRQTPYLHLQMNTASGYANGLLYYTDAYGQSGYVQLSQLVDGTANDFTANTDIYVDLSSYLQSGGTITLDSYTLSVYGVVGDSITWTALSTAKTAEETYLNGDVNNDGLVNTSDGTAIFRHILGTASLDSDALSRADYNGDGNVTSSDVRAILLALVNA